ncbi:hypothetical protein [Anoxynatronum sibiricum]|uniref:Sodium/calcium exchanger membrane region domain-containing protein n=1 Tax=Anoxynatronum sibiricum TaxID=210623 RepID=A0ABU9VV59_9CLOT
MEYIWFMVSALLVILAGNRLSAHGDSLAAHTKLGHGLVGGILIASVTSLPELASSISATMIGAPDIAFGNVYGSNAFNLMILAIVDLFQGKGSLLQIVRDSHILTAMFGILLTGISMLAIWITPYEVFDITIGWVSGYSILILFLYLFSAFLMVRYEEKTRQRLPEESKANSEKDRNLELSGCNLDKQQAIHGKNALKKAVKGFILSGIVIVGAGILLSVNADVIAKNTGLGQTFVGTLLVAGATSLPELVAAIAAIRIGAYDMAVGNVLGSNIFNILILVVTDLAYVSGSVYQVVSMQHILTAGTAMILSSIAVIGLFYRSKRTILTLGWDTVAILIGYVTMMFALFKISVK